MAGDHTVVCLCESTKFKAEFMAVQAAETLAGHIVLAPGVYSQADDVAVDDDQLEALTDLHLAKIRLADEVVVVAPGGVVGDATTSEIAYAEALGKPIQIRRAADPDVRLPIDPVDALAESHRVQRLVTNPTPTTQVPAQVKELRCGPDRGRGRRVPSSRRGG